MNVITGISTVRAAKLKGCDRRTIINAIRAGDLNARQSSVLSQKASWYISTDEKWLAWRPRTKSESSSIGAAKSWRRRVRNDKGQFA